MHHLITSIYIICEGPSEHAYLQELNKHLREKTIPLQFKTPPLKNLRGANGYMKNIKTIWSQFKKTHAEIKQHNTLIWIDKDLYQRADQNLRAQYKANKNALPDFYFNHHNFEDLLALHLPPPYAAQWCTTCVGQNHYQKPMFGKTYTPLFQSLIANYQTNELGTTTPYTKGALPDFITAPHMESLLQNLRINLANTQLNPRNTAQEDDPFPNFAHHLIHLLDTYIPSQPT